RRGWSADPQCRHFRLAPDPAVSNRSTEASLFDHLNVGRATALQVSEARSVGYEATEFRKFSDIGHRRETVLRGEIDDLFPFVKSIALANKRMASAPSLATMACETAGTGAEGDVPHWWGGNTDADVATSRSAAAG